MMLILSLGESAMNELQVYLRKAEEYHGHICSGQILGIRMALLGLKSLEMRAGGDLRDLMIFLESDRCVADAAYVVTGTTVGRRRMKMHNYGKTAMSFLDLKSGKAYRIAVATSDRPPHHGSKEEQLAFWEGYADEDIFTCQEVSIPLPDSELPGPPVSVIACPGCGEDVLDGREVMRDGTAYCRACAGEAYYQSL